MMKRKENSQGMQPKDPKKKTAREWDPRTLETIERTQPQRDKELEQVTCESDVKLDIKARAAFEGQSSDRIAESDVAEDTMSATVKLAKEIDEPDINQPTAECLLMALLQEKGGLHAATSSQVEQRAPRIVPWRRGRGLPRKRMSAWTSPGP